MRSTVNRRRFCLLTLAGMVGAAPGRAYAQERSPKNVVVTFPPPIPSRARLRAELTARFAGNCVMDGYGMSRNYEALQRAAKRVALGPRLDAGTSTYVLIAETHELVYDGIPADGSFAARDFRAVHALGLPPYVLVASAAVGIESAQQLPDLARRRAAAGRPLGCVVERGLGQHLGNRLARLLGAPLMLSIDPLPPHPHFLAERADTELFIAPLSLVLIARSRQGRLRPLAALAAAAYPVRRTLELLGAGDYALPRLVPDGPFASLGVVPTLGAFVARSESEDTVRRLHAAFVADAEHPAEQRMDAAHFRDDVDTPERAAAWYESERTRLEALARGAA